MSYDLATVSRQADEVVAKCGTLANPAEDIAAAIQLSRGVNQLRQLFSGEVWQDIKSLQGSPLGFLTDKDSGRNGQPYTDDVIREALIEGLLKGARAVGNEINIIAGRCYVTKQAYRRLLSELDGFANLKLQFEMPEIHASYAVVGVVATWTMHGKPDSIQLDANGTDTRIVVKHDAKYGSHDQAIGKAERKTLKMIWEMVTGQRPSVDDDDAVIVQPEAIAVESIDTNQSADLRDSLISRIGDCETVKDLKEINDERETGVASNMLTQEDSELVLSNLTAAKQSLQSQAKAEK